MAGQVLSATIDWDSWTPGSIPAARQAAQLDQLIATAVGRNDQWSDRAAQRGSLLASIEDHRLDRLAAAVTDAVARGDSSDTLARTLRGVLDDPRWAEMVATTEMNRAMSAASLASYVDAGIPATIWMSSYDQRVCLPCSENEAAGPIPLGSSFPSGDEAPPGHVLCRCCVAPSLATAADLGNTTNLGPSALGDLSEEDAALEDLTTEPAVDVVQHDTAGQTTPLSAADLAQLGAQRRGEREAAGETAAATPEARDVSQPSPDDLAARIAELPAGVADLRLGPDAGLGRFRVGRRRKRTGKAAGWDEEDDDED